MLTEGHAGDNVLELCAEVFGVIGKAGPSAAPLVDKTFDTLEPNFVGPDAGKGSLLLQNTFVS